MKKTFIGNLKDNQTLKIENGKVYLVEKINIAKWYADMYIKAQHDVNVRYFTDVNHKMIICYSLRQIGKTGVSKCHRDDIFIQSRGIAIAYARCRGFEIPEEIFE